MLPPALYSKAKRVKDNSHYSELNPDKSRGGFGVGTMLMGADGRAKKIEDFRVNERLMGDDGQPAKITSIVSQTKKRFQLDIISNSKQPLVVTGDHLLVLRRSRKVNNPSYGTTNAPKDFVTLQKSFVTPVDDGKDQGEDDTEQQSGDESEGEDEHKLTGRLVASEASLDLLLPVMIEHLFSLPRSARGNNQFLNALYGSVGIVVKSSTSIYVNHGTGKSQKHKIFAWNKLASLKETPGGPQWQREIVSDEAEAWRRARLFNREVVGRREGGLPAFTLASIRELLAGVPGNEAAVPGVPNLRVQMHRNDRVRFRYQHDTLNGVDTYAYEATGQVDEVVVAGPNIFQHALNIGTNARVAEPVMDRKIISVTDFLAMEPKERDTWKLFYAEEVSFGHDEDEKAVEEYRKKLAVDPYFLGLWLGDGARADTSIANNHEEPIVEFLAQYAACLGQAMAVPTEEQKKDGNIRYAVISKSAAQLAEPSLVVPRVIPRLNRFATSVPVIALPIRVTRGGVDAEGDDEAQDRYTKAIVIEDLTREMESLASPERPSNRRRLPVIPVSPPPTTDSILSSTRHTVMPNFDSHSSELGSSPVRPNSRRRRPPLIRQSSSPTSSPGGAFSRIVPTAFVLPGNDDDMDVSTSTEILNLTSPLPHLDTRRRHPPIIHSPSPSPTSSPSLDPMAAPFIPRPEAFAVRQEIEEAGRRGILALRTLDVEQESSSSEEEVKAARRVAKGKGREEREEEEEEADDDDDDDNESVIFEGADDYGNLAARELDEGELEDIIEAVINHFGTEVEGDSEIERQAEIEDEVDELRDVKDASMTASVEEEVDELWSDDDGTSDDSTPLTIVNKKRSRTPELVIPPTSIKRSRRRGKGRVNKLLDAMRSLGVMTPVGQKGWSADKKHIPLIYRLAPSVIRREVIAGLIDSDGSYEKRKPRFDFSQAKGPHQVLYDDFVFVCRSLGYRVSENELKAVTNKFWMPRKEKWHFVKGTPGLRAVVSGRIDQVPTLLARKQAKHIVSIQDNHCHSFKVKEIESGPVVILEVEGSRLLLRRDFLVVHSSQDES